MPPDNVISNDWDDIDGAIASISESVRRFGVIGASHDYGLPITGDRRSSGERWRKIRARPRVKPPRLIAKDIARVRNSIARCKRYGVWAGSTTYLLKTGVAGLPSLEGEVISLRFGVFTGTSWPREDLASALGVTVNKVKAAEWRGLVELKKLIPDLRVVDT